MNDSSFKDKVVIITGASSGIGLALAMQLAKEGAMLTLAARDAERLNKISLACQQAGGKAQAIPTDVSNEKQSEKLIRFTANLYGRVDVLINNAGISVVSKLEDLKDLQLFRQVMDVNFYGTVCCTFYAIPHLIKARGRIVNISSLAGFLPVPYNSPYVSSKFAITGLSDSIRMELAQNGVSVTLVSPYWVATEFHERYLDRDGKKKGAKGRAIYPKNVMTAEKCAEITLNAARKRRRQVVFSPGLLSQWIKLLLPAAYDRLVTLKFLKPISKRLGE